MNIKRKIGNRQEEVQARIMPMQHEENMRKSNKGRSVKWS